jgi:hypothetical protein
MQSSKEPAGHFGGTPGYINNHQSIQYLGRDLKGRRRQAIYIFDKTMAAIEAGLRFGRKNCQICRNAYEKLDKSGILVDNFNISKPQVSPALTVTDGWMCR